MHTRLVSRLTAPVATVSLLLLVTAVGAAWYVHGIQQGMSDALANHAASVRAAQELEVSLREVDAALDRYLITGDRAHLAAVPPLKRRTVAALEVAERLAYTPAEQVLMASVRDGYTRFFAAYDRILREPPAEGLRTRVTNLSITLLDRQTLDPAREYLRLNDGMLAEAAEANDRLAGRLTVGLVGVGLCGAIGGLFGGYAAAAALRRSIRRTETRLRDAADRIGRAVPSAPGGLGWPAADPVERMADSLDAVLDRLKQSERDALRAEQLAWVGQMAAGVAHEVRNPLMAIKLLVQAAAERSDARDFSHDDLMVLEEEIARLERIVAGFLDFARPPRPDFRELPVRPLLEQVAAGAEARAALQGVAVEVESSATPAVLRADPGQVRQVLYNLLFNALDALPRGGSVRLSAAVEPGAGGPAVVVRVEDDGPGLPPLGDRIFEPFVSTKESGLGLGLSICRRIVEAHGGTIWAADRPTGGAVFAVRLPVAGYPSPPLPNESPVGGRSAQVAHRG